MRSGGAGPVVRLRAQYPWHDQQVSEAQFSPSVARLLRPRSLLFWPSAMVLVTAVTGTLSWMANDDRDGTGEVPVFVTPVLDGADLAASILRSSDLRGAHVDRTDFSGADLRGSDLSGAEGSGTNLRRACLRNTKWDKAVLIHVDLTGADLRGADLSRAREVVPLSTQGVVVDAATKLPPNARWTGTVPAARAPRDQSVC